MWNEGFCSESGKLDRILSRSKSLQANVLGLMTHWVMTMLKGNVSSSRVTSDWIFLTPHDIKVCTAFPNYDWTGTKVKVDELQELVFRLDQVAKSSAMDMNSRFSENYDDDSYDSDFNSDSVSSPGDETLEKLLEDLDCYMESLVDLSSSLEHPADDPATVEEPGVTQMDELSGIPEPARVFAININDRFDMIDNLPLVAKLAEANLKRSQRLLNMSSSVRFDQNKNKPSNASKQLGNDGMTLSGYTKTSFDESNIFSASLAQSVQSAATSIAPSQIDGVDRGTRRIPSLPDRHDYGTNFSCQYCGEVQKHVKNRADWK